MGGKITTKYDDGARLYVSDEGIAVPGVTSVLNMIPKDFLRYWYAKMAAEKAVDAIRKGYFVNMAQDDPKGAANFIKGAAQTYSSGRADIGSAAHDQFERLINGHPQDSGLEPEVQSMVDNFKDFLEAVQPELVDAENIAWSDTHQYAGSYDAILRIKVDPETLKIDQQGEAVTVLGDWKTGAKTYPDVALQLAAYAHADRIVDAEGASRPMVATQGAAVLHVTKDQWNFKSVRSDEEVHAMFLSCLTFFSAVRGWNHGRESLDKKVLGKSLARSSKRMVSGTERRAK